jgi:Integrase core domain
MVTPAARREAVAHLRIAFEVSERRACSTLGADRTSIRYRSINVRTALAIWKKDYNTVRPHSALGNLPPAVFAKLSVPGMQRDGALRYIEGSAPRPVAPPSQQGSNAARTLLIGG